jgi:hypothetical protein
MALTWHVNNDPLLNFYQTFPTCRSLMGQRNWMQKTRDGEWDVIDVFTGQPVVEQGVTMSDMPFEEADDLVDLLNYRDITRRTAKGIG